MTGPGSAESLALRAVSWLGGALFAASLAYFLFSYIVTFRESRPGDVSSADIAVNAGLFGIFSLHHSLFARLPVRAWMSRHVSPQLERSVYVWVASLMLILVCALWRPIAGIAWNVTGPAVWPLWLGLAGGVWLTLRSAAIIDVWDLAGVRTRRPEGLRLPGAEGDDHWPKQVGRPDTVPGTPVAGGLQASGRVQASGVVFRTDGPYGWVRHPIYSGWFLIVFCVTPMTMTRLVFAIVSCAYILAAIPLEERTLRKTSRGEYDRYRQQVRWKLLPGIY